MKVQVNEICSGSEAPPQPSTRRSSRHVRPHQLLQLSVALPARQTAEAAGGALGQCVGPQDPGKLRMREVASLARVLEALAEVALRAALVVKRRVVADTLLRSGCKWGYKSAHNLGGTTTP